MIVVKQQSVTTAISNLSRKGSSI